MKRKVSLIVLCVVCAVCCAFALISCSEKPTDQTTPHTHNYQWIDNGDGTHKQHCSNAGCNAPDINSGSHNWNANDKCQQCGADKPAEGHTHNYQWIDNGDGTHKQHCSNAGCNAPDINSGSHNWNTNDKCQQCGADKPAEGHTHDYRWIDNGDGTHKQHCSNAGCNAPDINSGSHNWNANDKCQQCGADKPAEGHTHNYQWIDNGDGTHKQHCSNAGCNAPDINSGSHNWNANDKCQQCGADKPQENQLLRFALNESGDGYTVVGIDEGSSTDIIIPAQYEGKPVTAIGKDAFATYSNNSGNPSLIEITSCVIPSTVTSIGDYAFYATYELPSIVIPSSVTTVGKQVFANSKISSVELNCKTVGYCMFRKCNSLTSVTIGNTTTKIDQYAFAECGKLTQIAISNSVVTIDEFAFDKCTSLANVTLGNQVATIGRDAFRQCNLSQIEFPESLTEIGYEAFEANPFTEITIPKNVTTIGSYAFDLCYGLKKVNYNATACSKASDNVFYNDYLLTTVVIGNGVESIPTALFSKCYHLAEVVNKSSIELQKGFSTNGAVARYAVNILSDESQSTLTTVGNYEFCKDVETNDWYLITSRNNMYVGAKDIKITDMPASVNGVKYKIHDYAFYNVIRLTEVVIPNGVTAIGAKAFSECRYLFRLTLGENVAELGTEAFYKDERLAEVINLSSLDVKSLGTVNNLTEAGNHIVKSGDFVFAQSATDETYYLLAYVGTETEIKLPDSINGNNYEVAPHAFGYCNPKPTSLTIPRGVTAFGFDAFASRAGTPFSYCDALTSVIYEGTLEDWCKIRFDSECANPLLRSKGETFKVNGTIITSLAIPSSVTKINDYAFAGFDTMTSLTLHGNVKTVGVGAFYACTGITEVTIPASVTTLGRDSFADCSALGSVDIKSTSIKYMTRVFSGCKALVNIRFAGTQAQWEAITKDRWDDNTGDYTIVCSNGSISKS